jgi:ABC-type lipoprotein export system ATPase subunit
LGYEVWAYGSLCYTASHKNTSEGRKFFAMNVGINSGATYGVIQSNFNFTIPDGYTVLVGKNDSGKSSLLQLMFKTIYETGEIAKDRFCLLLPERIFIEPTLEVSNNTLVNYNNNLFGQLQSSPLPYHSQTHSSQSAFKLLISNHRQRIQLNSSDGLLEKLGFSSLDITQGNQVVIDNVNIGRHGSGLRTILPIIAVLTDPNIEYVLIDEPEQSLEPSIQKYVREMLYEYSQLKKIVVTTHSHLFLNRKTPQSNYIVTRTTSGVDLTQVQSDIEMYDLVYKLLGSRMPCRKLCKGEVVKEHRQSR